MSHPDADKGQLLGLAFSGGGIRSATFNLGVLHALARFGLLPKIHYLSTVSGGGYIGSWLASWTRRQPDAIDLYIRSWTWESMRQRALNEAVSGLCSKAASAPGSERKEAQEVRFLRKYSNYLTPRKGLLGADTWTVIGIYLRNFSLNLTVLVLTLLALLLLPRLLSLYFKSMAFDSIRRLAAPHFLDRAPWLSSLLDYNWPWIATGLLALAFVLVLTNLSSLFEAQDPAGARAGSYFASPAMIHLLVMLPILAASWWVGAWLWWASQQSPTEHLLRRSLVAGLLYVSIWVAGWLVAVLLKLLKLPEGIFDTAKSEAAGTSARFARAYRAAQGYVPEVSSRLDALRKRASLRNLTQLVLRLILPSFFSGAVGWLLLVLLGWWMSRWSGMDFIVRQLHFSQWAVPLVMLVFLMVETLHIGLAGKGFTEDAREWWGRLGGTLLLWTLLLSAVYALALDAPLWLGKLEQYALLKGWLKPGMILTWLATTGAGLLAGKSPATGGQKPRPSRETIGKIAPAVFVVGLLLILASATQLFLPGLIREIHTKAPGFAGWAHRGLRAPWPVFPTNISEASPRPPVTLEEAYWNDLEGTLDVCLWPCLLAFLGAALLLSWRVGINDFSMHALYRNRLVRCYLGATRWKVRRPHPFTGFDPEDDGVPLSGFRADSGYSGPFPIINTALNLVSGKELAWQQRKAASFVFTPLYSGYDASGFQAEATKKLSANGYRPAEGYGGGVTLGTAMAISGAAASPNMGYHSSPALGFLMTVFNVRLGWWLGNPRRYKTWSQPGPRLGLFYLLCELLGQTNDERGYVYLSDGGHFENLGIYELVRRRCRFIIACDASQDREMTFGDLGNAVEKCRTDLGVDIDINPAPLRLLEDARKSPWHCAIGTIRYDKLNPTMAAGTLLYLKPSLTGGEPADVQRYADEHPEFPHQTTADQWFDESQFESYRALGEHVAAAALEAVGEPGQVARMPVEELFVQLRQRWYPPSAAVAASFTKHTATYTQLIQKMQETPELRFLDQQVYPEWPRLLDRKAPLAGVALWLPAREEERRAGFYFCNEVIQMMEDAYIDLNLEEEYTHPDNRGWMNLFRHWAWSGMFCATWAVSAGIYGARFQKFCERRLDLRLGRLAVAPFSRRTLVLTEDRVENHLVLERAKANQTLNFWEVELVRAFLERAHRPEDQAPGFSLEILPFEMVVESPLRDGRELRFNVGFALVRWIQAPEGQTTAEIWYFRIQNHLRKMGLARAALNELLREHVVVSMVKEAEAAMEVSLVSGEPTSIDEAIPTAETRHKFDQLLKSVLARR